MCGAAWWLSHGAWAALELAAKPRLYFAKLTMLVGCDACQPRMADSEANFLTLASGPFFFFLMANIRFIPLQVHYRQLNCPPSTAGCANTAL